MHRNNLRGKEWLELKNDWNERETKNRHLQLTTNTIIYTRRWYILLEVSNIGTVKDAVWTRSRSWFITSIITVTIIVIHQFEGKCTGSIETREILQRIIERFSYKDMVNRSTSFIHYSLDSGTPRGLRTWLEWTMWMERNRTILSRTFISSTRNGNEINSTSAVFWMQRHLQKTQLFSWFFRLINYSLVS